MASRELLLVAAAAIVAIAWALFGASSDGDLGGGPLQVEAEYAAPAVAAALDGAAEVLPRALVVSDGVGLLVVDSADGRPCGDGVARLWRRDDYCPSSPPDQEVRIAGAAVPIEAALRGACVIECRVPGYVGLLGTCTVDADLVVVALERGGNLRVQVLGVDDLPAKGIRLELQAPTSGNVCTASTAAPPLLSRCAGIWSLPAGTGDSVALRFGVTTGNDGLAEWRDLPARSGYRWASVSNLLIDVDPPHENVRLREIGGAIRTGSPPPAGVSGRFAIAAGATVSLTARLVAGGMLSGRVAHGRIDRPAIAKLCRLNVAGDDSAARAVAIDAERHLECEPDGSFCFADVGPGLWIVRATWRDGPTDFWFASETCRLAAGASVDLGWLAPLPGVVAEVQIGVVDQDGARLALGEVFASDPAPALAMLSVNAVPYIGDVRQVVSIYEPVPYATTLRVHGLQPGRIQVWAEAGAKQRVDELRIGSLAHAGPFHLETANLRPLQLDLVAAIGSARALHVRDWRGRATSIGSLWVHDRTRGRTFCQRVSVTEHADEELEQRLVLPRGDYDLWASLAAGDGTSSSGGVRVRFDPAVGEPIALDLGPAHTVRGILRHPDGRPAAATVLRWLPRGWPEPAGGAPYAATTDAEGRFVVEAVPDHQDLSGIAPGADLAAGLGAVELVELTLAR